MKIKAYSKHIDKWVELEYININEAKKHNPHLSKFQYIIGEYKNDK